MKKGPDSSLVLLNRYRLLSELGRGGMGTIYRARDQALERDVAVKILTPSDLGTAGRARLLREAQAAAQLNHPNIVTIFDVGEADGTPFIVMELVDGTSLHEQPAMAAADWIRVASQVCTALEHAHAHGIVHRDLKPENILVAADGTTKLTDFGLALSLASRATSEGVIAGTVFYLAPEQALGQPVDGRSDLYALGVILYELTAGRLPFTAEDPLAVISQHLHSPVVLPSTYNEAIPPALESLILRLMAKQPDDRPASAAEVRLALASLDLSPRGERGLAAPSVLERIARGRLVGREAELQEARRLWERAAAGRGQVLLISGEPGVGKTRLTRELAAQASVTGATVLVGECYPEASAPYAPVSQVIQQAVDGRAPKALGLPDFVVADLMTLAPPLRARHPEIPPNDPTEPHIEQQRLSESILLLLASLSQASPVLLVLEDAHWADVATLSLVRHLAHRASQPELRLLTVLTYREVELDEAHGLHETLLELSREGLASRIKLGRLTRQQTREMLGVLFQEDVTEDFLDGIYRETEGNPFFIEEVCKSLIEDGVLTREGGHWSRPDMRSVQVPQSVQIAIQSRLARLPEDAQDTLRLASVIGREFDYDLLQALSDLSEDGLIDALEIGERAQLIEEIRSPGEGRTRARPHFAFVHALIPHTLSMSISGLRRQRLHRRVAEALEQLATDDRQDLASRIGRHFAEAGEWDRAARYFLRAGDHAQSVYAYQEAIAAYEEALGIVREQKETDREARTLMKLGSLYHSILDFPRSQRAYQQAFALWDEPAADGTLAAAPPTSRALQVLARSPETLDPNMATDVNHLEIVDQLFSGLVERTPEMDIVPDVARSWEISEGGRRYTFHLRPDVFWSDGAQVTSKDFEFSLKRILDPQTGSRNAGFLYDIQGAEAFHRGETSSPESLGIHAPDPLTLQIDLACPAGYFLHLLAHGAAYPVPAHVVSVHGPDWWRAETLVTNGPFLLERWDPRQRMVFARNPRFHRRAQGNAQRLEGILWESFDAERALRLYESDEVTCMRVPSAASSAFLEQAPRPSGSRDRAPRSPSSGSMRRRIRSRIAGSAWRSPTPAIEPLLIETQRDEGESVAGGGFVPEGLPGHLSPTSLSPTTSIERAPCWRRQDSRLGVASLSSTSWPSGCNPCRRGWRDCAPTGHQSWASRFAW